jgi:hypothetical protein
MTETDYVSRKKEGHFQPSFYPPSMQKRTVDMKIILGYKYELDLRPKMK